jgi:hypothetical protein
LTRSRWRSRASTWADQKRRNGVSQASTSMSGSGRIRYRRRCASARDSTKPASRNTRRCFDTDGCDIRNRSSILPTDSSEEASKTQDGSAVRLRNDGECRFHVTYIHFSVYTCQGTLPRPIQGLAPTCRGGPADGSPRVEVRASVLAPVASQPCKTVRGVRLLIVVRCCASVPPATTRRLRLITLSPHPRPFLVPRQQWRCREGMTLARNFTPLSRWDLAGHLHNAKNFGPVPGARSQAPAWSSIARRRCRLRGSETLAVAQQPPATLTLARSQCTTV